MPFFGAKITEKKRERKLKKKKTTPRDWTSGRCIFKYKKTLKKIKKNITYEIVQVYRKIETGHM